jgi:hypothetical protein
MTAPDFIVAHPDRVVRSILYVCWVATFNTAEHHMGLGLAQSQVRCMLFACNDGRNAKNRSGIDNSVSEIVTALADYRNHPQWPADWAVGIAESLAALRDMVVTP